MTMRPGRFLALIIALSLAAAALEHVYVEARSRTTEPGGDACWIWAEGAAKTTDPVAFFAVRDFKVDEIAGRRARLMITADESYVVYVNGRRVGSGGYHRGVPLDLYDVTADLETGWNRLAVELASSRGAGGLLAALRLDEEHADGGAAEVADDGGGGSRPIVVTGESWRILRRWESALARGWPLAGGETPQVWPRPPTGRWRLARQSSLPSPQGATTGADDAVAIVEASRPALRVRPQWLASRWRDLAGPAAALPSHLGAWKLFDWGEEVTGYLTLDLAPNAGRAALLHVGAREPDLRAAPDAVILPVPESPRWTDPFPRSFRYAFLAGLELRRAPAVRLVDQADGLPAETGVFGLRAERREPLVVEEIRTAIREGSLRE